MAGTCMLEKDANFCVFAFLLFSNLYKFMLLCCFHIIYSSLPVLLQKDVDFECQEEKKQVRGSTSSTKRSRAAEVHNLSERVCTYITLINWVHNLRLFFSYLNVFILNYVCRSVEIGSTKKWKLCKNLYRGATRQTLNNFFTIFLFIFG
jgi:hypothetical protein